MSIASQFKAKLAEHGLDLQEVHKVKRINRETQAKLVAFIDDSGISKKNAAELFKVSYASVMNWFSNSKKSGGATGGNDTGREVQRLKLVIKKFIELGGENLYADVKEAINKSEYEAYMAKAEKEANTILGRDLV